VQAQKMIWRPDPAKPQGLWLFGGALFSTSGVAPVQSYYMAGLVQHGTFPGRPNDSFGLMWAYYVWHPRFVDALNDKIAAEGLVGTLPGTENIVQASYSFELAPGIKVKPYAAITFNPDQQLFNSKAGNQDVLRGGRRVLGGFERCTRLALALQPLLSVGGRQVAHRRTVEPAGIRAHAG
jgi:carbohydrate-selective porin OprB